MRVVAKNLHLYGGNARKPGDVYEARDKDIRFMTAMGWIEKPAPVDEPPKRRYKRRDMAAEA